MIWKKFFNKIKKKVEHKHHWDAVGMSLDARSVIYECRECRDIQRGGFGRGSHESVVVDGDCKGIVFGVKRKLVRTIQEYEVTSEFGINDKNTFLEVEPSNRRGFPFMGEIKEFEQVYLETYGEEYVRDDS